MPEYASTRRKVHGADVELAVYVPVLEPEGALGHFRHQVEDVGGDARIDLGAREGSGQEEGGEEGGDSFHGTNVQILFHLFKYTGNAFESASYSVSLILE